VQRLPSRLSSIGHCNLDVELHGNSNDVSTFTLS
jgi:hypothetical protein